MPVKIRLQRHGKKGKPFYWVVAADARSKRDGKYLEKLGSYNPNTNPATIVLDLDSAVQWLHNGAQPTDTARAILSYKGALLKHHLDGGVTKGAMTQEQADEKLTKWLDEKAGIVDTKKEGLSKDQADAKAKALKAEKAVNDKRIADAKQADADLIAAATAAEAPEAEVEETVAQEAPAVEEAPEQVVAEEAPAEKAQAEAVAEAPAVEDAPVEEAQAEVVAEAPAVEEAPAEEEVAPEAAAPEAPAAEVNNDETKA